MAYDLRMDRQVLGLNGKNGGLNKSHPTWRPAAKLLPEGC